MKHKPDFIIIGSMKSGTTSLYAKLSKHSMVYMPTDKEPSILIKNQSIYQIKSAYLAYFKNSKENMLCGEASTNYSKLPIYQGIPNKAYELCGQDLKIIMIMRDPIERIYSHLRHEIAGKNIKPNEIDQAVLNDPIYISVSDYAMQLKPWVEKFGQNNILCISFNEYKNDHTSCMKKVYNFLSLPENEYLNRKNIASNQSSELRYTNDLTAYLINTRFYRKFIRPIVPNNLRSKLRNFILPKAQIPEFKLAPTTEAKLFERLHSVENEVSALLGHPIRINSNETS